MNSANNLSPPIPQSLKSNKKYPIKTPPPLTPQPISLSRMIPLTSFLFLSRTPSRTITLGTIPKKTSWSRNSLLPPERRLRTMNKYVTKKLFNQKNTRKEIPKIPLRTKQKTFQKTSVKPSSPSH